MKLKASMIILITFLTSSIRKLNALAAITLTSDFSSIFSKSCSMGGEVI